MDPINSATAARLQDGLITLDDVVAILSGDLPRMTDADLAAILCTIMNDGPHPVARIVEPVVRAELTRRRSTVVTAPDPIAP